MRIEDETAIKTDILDILLHHLGGEVKKTFQQFYADESLQLFVSQAVLILTELSGRGHAIELLQPILVKYHKEELLHV